MSKIRKLLFNLFLILLLVCLSIVVNIITTINEEKRIDKKNITIVKEASNNKIEKMIDVLYKDGLVFVKKNDLIDYLSFIFDGEKLDLDRGKYKFNDVGKEMVIDFNEKIIMIYEKFEEEVETMKLDEYYEKELIYKSYKSHVKYMEEKKKAILKVYSFTSIEVDEDDLYISLYDFFYELGYIFFEDYDGTYYLSREVTKEPNWNMTKSINKLSYYKLMEIVKEKVQRGIVEKDSLEYLEKNKKKFSKNFWKYFLEVLKISKDPHFNYVSNPVENTFEKEKLSFLEMKEYQEVNYLKIPSFRNLDLNNLYDTFEKMDKSKKLIIDLCGNPGGFEINVLYLISLLAQNDFNIYLKINNKKEIVKIKDMSELSYSGEIIILVDKGSYSASTVFSSIIQSNNLGKIVGEKTGGASIAQKIKVLPNGIALTVDTNKEYTNNMFESINGGLEPDILVNYKNEEEKFFEKQIFNLFKN